MVVHAEEMPDIHGQYGIAIDAVTGEVYYDKRANERAHPASITKMITGMLLEEHVEDGDVLIASEFAVGQTSSNTQFKLHAGEEITKEDAMYALMLISSNDVAVTIAEHIAGSQEAFAVMMTEKAREIGANDTNFVTASGLHDENHYTTAHDMARIAQEVLRYPQTLQAMGTSSVTLNTSMQRVTITNPSKIHENPLLVGGKTGYTNASGNTLVEIQEKDNKLVIAVVMKTTLAEEYNDIQIMADYAFERMPASQKIIESGEVVLSQTIDGEEVHFLAKDAIYVSADTSEGMDRDVTLEEELLQGELQKGDVVGGVEVLHEGVIKGETDLVIDRDINLESYALSKEESVASEKKGLTFGKIVLAIVTPIILYVIYVVYYNYRRQKIMREEYKNKFG